MMSRLRRSNERSYSALSVRQRTSSFATWLRLPNQRNCLSRTLLKLYKTITNPHHPSSYSVFNFHSPCRNSGETISAFVAALRKLSEHCAFGNTLNDMLRDRLMYGINDQRMEQDLPFAKALEISQAMEAADRNAQELGKVSANRLVQAISNGRSQRGGGAPHTPTCYRCGGKQATKQLVASRTVNATTAARKDTSPKCVAVKRGKTPSTLAPTLPRRKQGHTTSLGRRVRT